MATNQLSSIIPGFSALTADSSNLIKQLMSGQLTGSERRAIYDAGAERGVAGGMPGSTGMAGSLFANADLRNIGVASGQRQQQGFQDLLAMLQGYSGTVAPTTGQEIQQRQFLSDADFRRRQADFQNELARDEFGLRRKEYEYRYGPKKRSFGTIQDGEFTTRLRSPGDFGATGGAEGFEMWVSPSGEYSKTKPRF